MHARVVCVKGGSGGSVVVVVVGRDVVVVVVFPAFSVVVVVVFPGFSVVVVVVFAGFSVVDVLDVEPGRASVVVVVVLVVVLVTAPGNGHLTRQAGNPVRHAVPSRNAWPLQALAQPASVDVAHFALQLASALVTAASHDAFFPAQPVPQLAPAPGAKHAPTAAL